MNTRSDFSLDRLSDELRSHSLELRTKASELIYAAQRARQHAVLARTALETTLGVVVSIGVGLRLRASRHAYSSPKPVGGGEKGYHFGGRNGAGGCGYAMDSCSMLKELN